jgi:diphthamide synthase (EF-2-diphthine--ammonia ligase)|tara:strand:+ start:358 stop:777 length:420 start_codon:yes stop_codon:yes gene_type:complete
MSSRTRFEIETFLLGAHPTVARQALELQNELMQARTQQHPDLAILEAVSVDFVAKNGALDALIGDIESSEEEYWVSRLARLAAIDILTIGKVQPEHMNYMASLSDDAFASCVKSATTLAKSLNDSVQEIEAELGSELTN